MGNYVIPIIGFYTCINIPMSLRIFYHHQDNLLTTIKDLWVEFGSRLNSTKGGPSIKKGWFCYFST
jgi:hypothetical protein